MTTEEIMGETISLTELYQTLKRRFVLIFVIAILAAAASGVVSYFFLTPTYQVSTQLIVSSSNGDNQVNNVEIQGNIQLINTYNDILASPAILDKVIEQLNLPTTASQLREQMTISNAINSQVINLTVQGEDPNLARDIANTTAKVFQANVGDIMNVDNVSILAEAEVPEGMGPISPRPTLNIAVAFVVGLLIGVGLAFLLDYLDKTVKTEQDIEKLLGLPVLGIIPTVTTDGKKGNQHVAMDHQNNKEIEVTM